MVVLCRCVRVQVEWNILEMGKCLSGKRLRGGLEELRSCNGCQGL